MMKESTLKRCLGAAKAKGFSPLRAGLLLCFGFLFLPAPLLAAANHFSVSSIYGAGPYNVNQGVTFRVQALDASNALDTGYNQSVTISFYGSGTTQISDPLALFGPGNVIGVGPVTGTAILPFTAGVLDFWAVFKAGASSEQLYLRDTSGTQITNIYPAGNWSIFGTAFHVTGYSQTYYLKDANNDSVPVSYIALSTIYDTLTTDQSAVTYTGDRAVTIPYDSAAGTDMAVTNAATYAVTGINGGYAFGTGTIDTYFQVQALSNSPQMAVSYLVILDYNGTLNDFNHPRCGVDTIFAGGFTNAPTSWGVLPPNPANLGCAPFTSNPFFNNGQIIVRIWTTTNAPGNPVSLRYGEASTVTGNLSYVNIPYSNQNIQPVKMTLSPPDFLSGAAATVTCVITNQTGSNIAKIFYKIPANSSFPSTDWNFPSLPTSILGYAGSNVSYANPVSATDGAVTITFANPNYLGVNQAITLLMPGFASNIGANTPWGFNMQGVTTDTGISQPFDNAGVTVYTQGVPNTPATFSGAPANFNSGGNSVTLAWAGPVTNEGASGYILSRRLSGPSTFSAVQTIFSNATLTATDNTVTNLTSYDYTIAAFNQVTRSVPATFLNVVPFNNPGIPASLTAKSGGTSVQLSWPTPAAGSYPVSGYQVFQGTASGAETLAATVTGGAAISFTSTGLSQGVSYFYKVAAFDSLYVSGAPGTAHITGLSTESSGYPPGNPPTGLAVTLTSSSPANLRLNWTAPVNNINSVLNYLIERGVNGGGNAPYTVVSSSPTTFNDAAVTAGSLYTYQVAAIDSATVTSNLSTQVLGRVGPAPPSGLSASPSNVAITLTWTANPPSEGVTAYHLYRNSVQIASTGPTTLTFLDSTAVQGTNYGYQLEAVDNVPVTSPLSAAVSTAYLPNIPGSLSAVIQANDTSVDLAWTAPSSSGNLTGYKLFRNTINTFAGSTTLTTTPVTLAYTDSSPTTASAGTTFFYFLQALNIGGGGATILKGIQIPPNPPATIGATSSAAAITVNWTDPNAAAEKVSGYKVYRVDLTAPATVINAVSTSPTTYTDGTAVTGHDYYYYVTASNSGSGVTILGGESLKSGSVTIGRLPQTPTGLAVTIDSTALSNTVTFTWGNVLPTDPNAQSVTVLVNGSPVTGYAASASATIFTDVSQGPDASVTYSLLTRNAYGNGVTAAAVSQLTYPAPVTLTSVSAVTTGARAMSWVTVGSGDVSGYVIYRELQGASSFVSMGFISSAGLTFPVTVSSPLLPGRTYLYRITAINATGEGSSATTITFGSAPSAPVSVAALSGVSNAVTQVNLTWADPVTLSEGVTAFTVYRAFNNAAVTSYSPLASGLTTLNYSDSAVTGTGVYYYIVAAVSQDGRESTWTTANAVSVTAFALPNPPVPSAVPANGSVTLTWGVPSVTTYPVSIYNLNQVSGGVTMVFTTAASPYIDSSVVNGTSYVYTIQTMDSQGNLSPASAPVTAQPLASPNPPTGVAVGAGDSELLVTWNSSVAGTFPIGQYLVFRSLPGPVTLLAALGPTVTGYLDDTPPLVNGNSYSYFVVALDNSGVTTGLHVSANSTTVIGSPVALNVNPPSNLAAAAGVSQVIISWTDSVTIGGGSDVTSYNIYKSTSPSFTLPTTLGPFSPGGSPVTDTGLTNGTIYYYYMVANSATTVSAHSATVLGIPSSPPAAPAPVSVVDGNAQVDISWGASPNQGSVTIKNYALFQGVLPSAPVSLGFTGAAVTTYSDGSVNNSGQTVVYQVAAINSNNTLGALSAAVTGYPYGPFSPTGLAASGGTTTVTLTFAAPGSPSWPVTQYEVVRTPLGGGTPVTFLGATSPVTDTTPVQGQLYVYTALAMDNKGHLSGASSAVTEGASNPPAAPATLIVSGGDQQILLDWPAPVSIAGSFPVSFYILTGPAGGPVTLPASQPWYLDTGLGTPVTVSYSVQAVDATGQLTGNHASTVLGPVSGATSASNLNPPTALTAQATSGTNIRLTWALPNDQGRIVTGFHIFRSGSFNGPYSGLLTLPNPALAPVTVYNDASVNPSTTYYYVVRAVYAPGSVESPNSNHAWDTTTLSAVTPPPITLGQMALDANLFRPLLGPNLGIYYDVPNDGVVEIDIYNVAGNQVATLVPGMTTAGVKRSVAWDGKDRNGNLVASGLYLIEIRATGFHQIRKVAVVK